MSVMEAVVPLVMSQWDALQKRERAREKAKERQRQTALFFHLHARLRFPLFGGSTLLLSFIPIWLLLMSVAQHTEERSHASRSGAIDSSCQSALGGEGVGGGLT